MTPRRRTGVLLALATACLSGVSVFVNSFGVRAFPDAAAYTTAKNVVAAAILLAMVLALRGAGARLSRPAGPGQWGGLLAVGVVGGSVPFVLFFEGLSRASSAQAAFLHKTLVLWVAVLAVVVLGERLHWLHGVAIGLLLVGQAWLLGGVTQAWASGELMILAATALWAVEVVLAKRLLGALSSWTLGVARMGLGSVVLLGWLGMRGDLGLLTSMSAEQLQWVLVTGAMLAAYVATWFAALARAQAVDVTAVLVLAAPVTAMLDAVWNGAALPNPTALVVVVCGGLLALGLAGRRLPEDDRATA